MSPRHDQDHVPGPTKAGGQLFADLPYSVVLWDLPRTAPERVLARAASINLARSIFVAAQSEHLGRKIALMMGPRSIAESG